MLHPLKKIYIYILIWSSSFPKIILNFKENFIHQRKDCPLALMALAVIMYFFFKDYHIINRSNIFSDKIRAEELCI